MLIFNGNCDRKAKGRPHLNTSHVNLQRVFENMWTHSPENLNTSHVNLQRRESTGAMTMIWDLNTSHVNLQR